MPQLSESAFRKLLIALGIYITALIGSNTLGIKIMPFLFDSHLSVGVFMFPIVFLMTDIVGEVYGKKIAKFFVLAGVIATLLWIAFTFLSLAMPWSSDGWAIGSYETVFGMSLRIAIASIVAFTIAEYQDVISFFFFKKTIGEGGFWLRSNLSNLWSQFLDTVIFMVIAFLGIYPLPVLASLIVTWWLYKVAMGLLYTPLAYVGIKLLKDKDGSQTN
ncbi:MAG: queuosine precursor transporter [Patescibacteria group bacterium]